MQENIFDLGKWQGALIFQAANFKELQGYLGSERQIENHLSSLRMYSVDEDGEKTEYPLSVSAVASYNSSFADSLLLHANMMIVMAGAYYENIIFDFLQNYFVHKPNSLHRYVGGEKNTGFIKVTEAVSFSTIHELISDLASRAAKNAGGGAPVDVIKRINSLTKNVIDSELEVRIVSLIVKRNAIAHDLKQYSHEQVDVDGAYQTLSDVLEVLGRVTYELGMPVYDPGDLLELRVQRFMD